MTAPVTPLLPLNEDMNARRWAQDFIERWKGYTVGDSTVDEGLMIAWFANAIMCGFDNGYRKSATSEIDPKESAAPQDGAHEKQHGDTAPAVAAPDDKPSLVYRLHDWCNQDFTGKDVVEDAQWLMTEAAEVLAATAKSASDPLKCRTCRSSLVQATVDKCDSGEACPFYRYRSADRGAKS